MWILGLKELTGTKLFLNANSSNFFFVNQQGHHVSNLQRKKLRLSLWVM